MFTGRLCVTLAAGRWHPLGLEKPTQRSIYTRRHGQLCTFCMGLWRAELANLGKTLNLELLQLSTPLSAFDMFRLLSQIARFLPTAAGVAPVNGVAHNLMERAEARSGRNPRGAQELRGAALAFLRVIR
jgi:hypothetical protein